MVKYVSTYKGYTIKKIRKKNLFDDDYEIFFSDFLYKGICCGYALWVRIYNRNNITKLIKNMQIKTKSIT